MGGVSSSEEDSEEQLTGTADRLAKELSQRLGGSSPKSNSDGAESLSSRQESLEPGEIKDDPLDLGEGPVDALADSATQENTTSKMPATPLSKEKAKQPSMPHSAPPQGRRHGRRSSLDALRSPRDGHRRTSSGSIAGVRERPSSDVSPMLSFEDIKHLRPPE